MMGVEVQKKIINDMLLNTANDMRLIAAKLVPYMMIKGNTMDICAFNGFTDELASNIESQASRNNTAHFAAPTILAEHIDTFLFNLGMCICRTYHDICDNCAKQETCLRANNKQTSSPHIVPISKKPAPKKPKVHDDDDTDEFL